MDFEDFKVIAFFIAYLVLAGICGGIERGLIW